MQAYGKYLIFGTWLQIYIFRTWLPVESRKIHLDISIFFCKKRAQELKILSNFDGISNFNDKVDTLKSNALRSKLPHAAVLLSNHQVTLQDKKIHGS